MCGLKVTQLCGRFPRAAKEPTKPLTAYNPFFPYRLRIFDVLLDISSMAPPEIKSTFALMTLPLATLGCATLLWQVVTAFGI